MQGGFVRAKCGGQFRSKQTRISWKKRNKGEPFLQNRGALVKANKRRGGGHRGEKERERKEQNRVSSSIQVERNQPHNFLRKIYGDVALDDCRGQGRGKRIVSFYAGT